MIIGVNNTNYRILKEEDRGIILYILLNPTRSLCLNKQEPVIDIPKSTGKDAKASVYTGPISELW